MTSAIGTPPQTDSSCGSGEHDLVSMGSMVQFHQKMVKDAEEQKPFVAIVARLIAKLVDNNDKAREVLQLAIHMLRHDAFHLAAAIRQRNHCFSCPKSTGRQCC
jgi:hypothetical protein